MNPPMNLLAKLILKDFRVSFLYFFIQKKMLAKFTNIKKYRAVFCGCMSTVVGDEKLISKDSLVVKK
ncbi:hypothetical protein LIU_03080 [Enterococcus durans]|nr:hypothetical protein LIU_03080 [Enterococcus durans]